MNVYLITSAVLIIITGTIHSVLGEKLILIPVFKMPLPPLLKSEIFMKRVLRMAWHMTTLAWWGIGYIFWRLAQQPLDATGILFTKTILIVCLISGLFSLVWARGRHFSWMVFLLVSYLLWKAMA